ncbi:MAG: excinuclease ABC subunit UvrC [Candidatus Omnitrophica bacterium]|nr:excinuclease ABC subunit UvrC [Candidatus Omnitrophota bacterium]
MLNSSERIKLLPLTSGVYLMKDASGVVIYVGKAVSLRKRVQSYFRGRVADAKTEQLVTHIASIDVMETQSEAEALILEASLIKQYHPKYNIDLRDDKSYPLIEITGDEFPRIFIRRPRERNPTSIYYGPYVGAHLVREALNIIRKIFPFCVCSPGTTKLCLDYHIGLCTGPCAGKISRVDYLRNIKKIRLILEGKKNELFRSLSKDMERLSQAKRFEKAAVVRDQIRAIGALYSGTRDVNYYKEAEQLQRALNLPKPPLRIETFDISNIMGIFSVGSMVAFLNGMPDKANYRRFRIKTVTGIDDFKMIAEVVRRRYTRLKTERALFPDLVVIDGGKGQLSAAADELKKLEVDIPLISLAKQDEEIFTPERRSPVRLPKDSLGLHLLQRCRDEAHRFAVNYHRLLRGKGFKS